MAYAGSAYGEASYAGSLDGLTIAVPLSDLAVGVPTPSTSLVLVLALPAMGLAVATPTPAVVLESLDPNFGTVVTVLADGAYNSWPGVGLTGTGRRLVSFSKGSSHVASFDNVAMLIGSGDGVTWDPAVQLSPNAVAGSLRYGAAGILVTQTGRWLYMYWQQSAASGNPTRVRFKTSDDAGATWSDTGNLAPYDVSCAAGSQSLFQHAGGRIFATLFGMGLGESFFRAGILYSDDNGDTWNGANPGVDLTPITISPTNDSRSFNEASIVEEAGGTLLFFVRTQTPGTNYLASSTDTGITWSALSALPFASAPGMPGAVIFPHLHEMLLFYRDAGLLETPDWRRSDDYGVTWTAQHVLDAKASEYAAAVPLSDTAIAVAYAVDFLSNSDTSNPGRSDLKYVEASLASGPLTAPSFAIAIVMRTPALAFDSIAALPPMAATIAMPAPTVVLHLGLSLPATVVALALLEPSIAGIPPTGIVVDVYDVENPATLLGTLTTSFKRQWRDPFLDLGTFSVSVPARNADGTISADAALLAVHDRIVRFRLNGSVAFAGVVAPIDRVSVDPQEEAAQILTASGPGALALLANAAVFPERGIGRVSPAQRLFNFASKDYEDAGWTTAVEIKQQGDQSIPQWRSSDGHTAPASWPDYSAWWIWSRPQAAGSPPQPVGSSYFRKTFTLSEQTPCAIFITADDGFDLYLDDDLVAQETRAFMWNETRRTDILLDAGDHVLAIKGTNIDRPSVATNVAGVLCSVMMATDGGDVTPASQGGTVLVHTDDTWRALDYPLAAPTMTPGQILKILIDEAHADSYLTGVTYDFDAFRDSNGSPWGVPVDVGYAVGTSVLDVVRNLIGLAIDIRLDPATFVLSAFNKGTGGTARPFTLVRGEHLTALQHQSDGAVATDALVQYHTGQWTLVSTGSVPRKAIGLSIGGAPSDDQASRAATVVLARDDAPKRHVTWGVAELAGATPYTDYLAGDTLTLPDDHDVNTITTITAIVVGERAPGQDGRTNGTPVFACEGVQ